ncbi:MAG: 16S rRNA (cytidine(1402)-2'-O)-methyltransferase [Chloroflexota bacterium]|nr:16S rRNA (cytidine(1402)-2'-O)-methyltransferase [Chloroflexota bacterium]
MSIAAAEPAAQASGMGTLFVVATPIGNLEDISARALRVLAEVDLIAAEDTRHTRKLLRHFGISTPLRSYHAHNAKSRHEILLDALVEGDVALVSDAGTPGISDPGQELVDAVLRAGFPVSPVPGPSALIAAVSISGLVAGPFLTLGFLPRKGPERRRTLGRAQLAGVSLIIFEAPSRLVATLRDLASIFGERKALVARELTKLHEEVRRDSLAGLASYFERDAVRGECVVVIGPAAESELRTADDPRSLVTRLVKQGMKPSEIARETAAITGLPRDELYALAREVGQENCSKG